MRGLLTGLSAATAGPEAAFRAVLGLLRFGESAPPVPETTAPRRRQALNRVVQTGLVRRVALAEAARASAARSFASRDEAVAARDDLLARLDAEIRLAGGADRQAAGVRVGGQFEDAAYSALTDLRARVAEDLTTRAAGLARVVVLRYPTRLPAAVLLYRETGGIDGLDAFVERNKLTLGVRARREMEFLQ